MESKLIIVGTPIGNLNDMSPRAIEALRKADFIAAEDTRVTIKLLNHFGIKKPMISYFEHNKNQKDGYITERILAGETCVLVSDAGLPAISDPGETLVQKCIENNIEISVVPGPCALVSALVVSGLPTGRFTFEGFLSVTKKSRIEHLENIKKEPRTMIFYEAPHKLLRTLKDLLNTLGNRKIAIIRELTKIHEEIIRTTLEEAINKYEKENIKGEIVLIIDGYKEHEQTSGFTLSDAMEMAQELLIKGYTLSEAAKQTAKVTNLRKSDIYKALL